MIMNDNTYNTEDILKLFKNKYNNGEFRGNTVELQNIHFICDKDYIVRKPNYDYAKREIEWYESQSLNVNDIPGGAPTIWKQVATSLGYINSNYGWCIFGEYNGKQYEHCLKSLLKDHMTRQAVMIYTRPQMQTDWNKNGMHDFMCTHYVHCFLNEVQHPENNVEVYELKYIVYQRSCDAVFGFNNDFQWHKYVYDKLYNDLIEAGIPMSENKPFIEYNCGSLHVYDRHFKHLEN